MAEGKFVAYYRVSTVQQGKSGLGLEAQQQAVMGYLNGGNWTLVREFVEVESGKGDDNRPQLKEALSVCRATGSTLIISKLDRLSRDAHFLLGLQKAGVRFVCADMPEANELTVGIMAVIAQAERKMISRRTKEALQAAKNRGVKLGKNNLTSEGTKRGHLEAEKARKRHADLFAQERFPYIEQMQKAGLSLNAIASKLNAEGFLTSRGKVGAWTPSAVSRILRRAVKNE